MKIIIASILFSLLITSCATVHNSSVLYREYSQYQEVANKNNIVEMAENFFSPNLLGTNYQTNPDAVNQLLFKNYMANISSHHEKVDEIESCLTINGYDEERFPLIFSLKYILLNGHWLIDNIHVVFVENESDFSNNAKCPSQYPN